ncbi:uncharacterized protein LOC131015724 [Salvia miltiorrhiza]|uniref:uncharacterized protein LOC131015724 n=1 Tax=Salvia miltiorrhiza TaxID=226208 RepID=UPI0025ACEBCF|nr:uncharacterized protein LOC131015724 [Salvia miltiorrhiza]
MAETDQVEAIPEQTLRQLAYPTNLNLRPNGITLPVNLFAPRRYDLKPSLLQILPKFNGYPGDDPHTHLQDFEMTIMHQSSDEQQEYVKLILFPFTLVDNAGRWLYDLPADQVESFVKGMWRNDHSLVLAACNGSLMSKTPLEIFQLLGTMAEESRDERHERNLEIPRKTEEKEEMSKLEKTMEKSMNELKELLSGLTIPKKIRQCGLCDATGHQSENCPNFGEDIVDYQLGPPQHHNQKQQQPPYQPPHRRAPWEETIENMAKESEKFRNEIRVGMNQTNQQISHLTKAVAKLEKNAGKLPAMRINPREHAQVVLADFPEGEEKEEELLAEAELILGNLNKSGKDLTAEQTRGSNLTDAPYPGRLRQKAKEREASEMMKMFQKVELSIPLLDAIRKIPKYAKFLKDLCSRKVKMEEEVRYVMRESVSAVIQRKLPTKRKDPGMFTIPCNIGGTNMDKAMMDLGASINVMPLAVYRRLNIGEMRNTRVVIQLADRSNAYLEGVVEDVLIKVGDLIFPADFYVLDTGPETGENAILLGRPFMMTAGTKIDIKTGILTCEFDGVQEEFNIYETMKRK